MLQFVDLSYRYRSGVEALTGVNASITPGIHLLLGENGAGKTTLLHLASALRFPTAGKVLVDGVSTTGRKPELMRRVFFLPDNLDFPQRSLKAFAGVHSKFYPNYNAERLESNLMSFGLTGNERFRSLSLGGRRKSAIAYALALGVDVLLLDEPANGLDIYSKEVLRRMIGMNVDDGQTVLVATHTVGDLETLYDGVMMFSHGHLLINASTDLLQNRLAFVTGSTPSVNALHYIQRAGLFRSVEASNGELETSIDFNLLYFALHGENSEAILKILNS